MIRAPWTAVPAFAAALAVALFVAPFSTSPAAAPAFAADVDVAGEWTVSFATERGPLEFTMYVLQDGQRLSGRLTSESGEFPLRGTATDAGFTITWSFPDTGGTVDITFAGTVDGDTMSGTAKLGRRGSGPLSGTRVGR